MNRREVLKSAGIFGAGAAAASGTILGSDIDFDNTDPEVVFEGGKEKFTLEDSSDATQAGALVNGNAVLTNTQSSSVDGEFQTYFVGELDGENYGFQGSTEVQHFGASETEEVSVKTELQGEGDFELKEFVVVFIQER